MKATYEFSVKAECPVDAAIIEFAVTVTADWMITVEELLAHCHALTNTAIMQEPFTEALASRLQAQVTTTGTHSGVKITCSA